MKLIYCPDCQDVFKLDFDLRKCKCGKSSGMYNDNRYAVTNGHGISLAIGNGSLINAMWKLKFDKRDLSRDRSEYIDQFKVICWVRPNEGMGNPHTRVDNTL